MKTSYSDRWLFSVILAIAVIALSGMTAPLSAQTSNTGTVTGVIKTKKEAWFPALP